MMRPTYVLMVDFSSLVIRPPTFITLNGIESETGHLRHLFFIRQSRNELDHHLLTTTTTGEAVNLESLKVLNPAWQLLKAVDVFVKATARWR